MFEKNTTMAHAHLLEFEQNTIHQYTYKMRFMVPNNRRQKASQSVPFFKCHKNISVQLRIKVRGHFEMSFTGTMGLIVSL